MGIDGTQVVGWFANSNEVGIRAFLYDAETGEFTNLGTFPGGDWSEAFAVEQGVVVGFAGNTVMGDPPLEAFIYQDGVMLNLGEDLGTPTSRARDIANGIVTGSMGQSLIFDGNAYIWDQGDVMTLPPIPGGFLSQGFAINGHRDVVGRGRLVDRDTGDTVGRAFAWIDDKMISIGPLPGFSQSTALDVNDAQHVVGAASTTGLRAFVWRDGVVTDLNDLISPGLNLTIKVATGINEAGQITADADSDDLDATV